MLASALSLTLDPMCIPGLCVCLQGGFLTRRTAVGCAAVAAVGLIGALAIKVLDTPSRPYDADANTVGNEYDAWTEVGEGVRRRQCRLGEAEWVE